MINLNRTGERYITNEGYWITIIEYFSRRNCTLQFEDGTTIKNRNFSSIKRGSVRKPINRVGEKHVTNQGYNIEIIEWGNANNCSILFCDTRDIVKNIAYIQVTTGSIRRPKESRIGEKYITKEGCEIEITEYFSSHNVTIKFKDGLEIKNRNYLNIQQGGVKNPNHPSVYSTGYEGVGEYSFKNNNKCYNNWREMIRRGYSKKHKDRNPSYSGCCIIKEWHNFQNFAKWHEENWKKHMDSTWELDKDILQKGNKTYSPETCCFVPKKINLLFVKNNIRRGELPIGVNKSGKNFNAKIMKNNKEEDLGTFKTPEQAFQAYKTAKEAHIKEVADKWRGQITEPCYEALINYQVEITD